VLRGKQGRYCEAFPLINRAAAIYRRAYLHEDLARVLITKGHLLYVVGDPQRGISELEEGLGLARKVADRRLVLAAKHNLAHCLEECSRLAEAEGLLREIRPEYAALGDSLSLLRLRWFEGKVARRKGETEAAEAAFREVRDAFASRGMSFDTALASLDLAAVLLQRGQAAEMRQLAQESVALFQSLKVPRETLAAILLLETAIQQQRLTVVLLHDFAAFLDKARSNPSLRFWPSI
jgi:tetratricopeptide (TPR) repeat protein